MSTDETLKDGWIYVRSTVEMGQNTDEEWFTYPRAEWEALTDQERDNIRTEYAVQHQNNVAACGASEVDDAEEIPGYVLDDPAGHQL